VLLKAGIARLALPCYVLTVEKVTNLQGTTMDLTTLISLPVIIVIAIVIIAAKAWLTVPQGFEYTLERFGKYKTTMSPGFHIITPFFESVGRRMNMMEQVLDVPRQEVITKDNAMVGVDAVVFYQVQDAAKAAYEVDNLRLAVVNLTMTNIRTVVGAMDLDETLSKRDEINHRLLRVVDEATVPWGMKVTRIEIKDIQPPQDLIDSMGRQMKAERDKRANILEAEGFRQAAILKAEGEKQAAVLSAEGAKEAAFRTAEARERSAEAEARATQVVSEAINKGSVQAINYFVAQKYVESLKEFARSPNQKVFFMPVEASGILASLGGIAELARDSMTKQAERK
jgi:regulator of protease activity HflC (stomatin/prohibitin superfamily)